MEKKEVLKLCMENGFFLDRAMLEFFVELEEERVLKTIAKLKEFSVPEKILNMVVFDRYKERMGVVFGNSEINSSVNILKNISSSPGKIETGDFVNYFRARFESLKDILMKDGGLESLSSIRRIGSESGVFNVIGMVYDKRITKNKNLLIEIEDLTGRTIVLVNRENKVLFDRAKELLLDDIVAFKVSGSSKMLFANDFIYPGSNIKKENFGNKDEFVAFSGDFHVGSKMFLEGNLMKFVDWLNGEVGDNRQKSLARKVKYLILNGDNVDGAGVYPGQEKFLNIKKCRNQYKKLVEILDKIRKDVEIVMCPGQHDAVWVGEPQPSILSKWGGALNEMSNLRLVSNPSMIEIGGLKFFIYHGASLNRFIDQIDRLRINFGHKFPVKVVEEILKRRHLAPIYGEMDIVPNKLEDDLVLGELPDVFAVGGQHRAAVGGHNNILIVSSSCWQSKTNFDEKVGNNPDPCRVPILNLKTKEVKILDFSDDEISWQKGRDLVCKLEEVKNEDSY